MLIVYDSFTGNVQRFIRKLSYQSVQISDALIMRHPFILITYTIGFGEVPPSTAKFLENNHQYLLGVASSGNRNWGDNYARSADIISNMYHVPCLLKFELGGMESDVKKFILEVEKFVEHSTEIYNLE